MTSYFRIPPLEFAAELQNWICSRFAPTQKVPGQKDASGLYLHQADHHLEHYKCQYMLSFPRKGASFRSPLTQFCMLPVKLQNTLLSHKKCQDRKPFLAFLSHEQPLTCIASTGSVCLPSQGKVLSSSFMSQHWISKQSSETEHVQGVLPYKGFQENKTFLTVNSPQHLIICTTNNGARRFPSQGKVIWSLGSPLQNLEITSKICLGMAPAQKVPREKVVPGQEPYKSALPTLELGAFLPKER